MNATDLIFVAGHRGLVGSAIVRALKAEGYTNLITRTHAEVDLTDPIETWRFIAENQPDYIFLAAAKVGGIEGNMRQPVEMMLSNLHIQNNVLSAAHHHRVKKLLFLGSSCIFPKFCPQPIKEEYLLTSALEPSNECYALAKIAGLKLCQAYRSEYGDNFVSVMPTNLYGPCFSKDTQIMTPEGPRFVADIAVDDFVYTLDPKTHSVRVTRVMATQLNTTKEWFNFKGKSTDLKVTSDHKMYFGRKGNFTLKPAEWFRSRSGRKNGQMDIARHEAVRSGWLKWIDLSTYRDRGHTFFGSFVRDSDYSKSKDYPYHFVFDAGDFAELVGWIVSEGSTLSTQKLKNGLFSGKVHIAQKTVNESNRKQIFKLVTRLGFRPWMDSNGISFTSRLVVNFVKEELGCCAAEKRIPSNLLTAFCSEHRKRLFDALMAGDGHKSGCCYTTKSTALKSSFLHLCFLLGIKTGTVFHDGCCWRIVIRKSKPSLKYRNISITSVDDLSYCFTAERDHIIFAGRNGCFTWVGQCDTYRPGCHVIPDLIRKFYQAKVTGQPTVSVWGDGTARREFLYSDDLARACVLVMQHYDLAEPINIGFGTDVTIKDLAAQIADTVGLEREQLVFSPTGPVGTPVKFLDSSRIMAMGWKPAWTLADGLKMAYADFLKNHAAKV